MLSPSASAPELEAGVHSGIGAPLPITAVQNLSLQQLHLHRPSWWEGFGCGRQARWHCGSESLFRMGLWRVGMEREKDISVPRWVLSSLWSFVPSGLAGSQTLMGLVWLCVCRKKHTNSSCPGSLCVKLSQFQKSTVDLDTCNRVNNVCWINLGSFHTIICYADFNISLPFVTWEFTWGQGGLHSWDFTLLMLNPQ